MHEACYYLAKGLPGKPCGSKKAFSKSINWSFICLTKSGLKNNNDRTI